MKLTAGGNGGDPEFLQQQPRKLPIPSFVGQVLWKGVVGWDLDLPGVEHDVVRA